MQTPQLSLKVSAFYSPFVEENLLLPPPHVPVGTCCLAWEEAVIPISMASHLTIGLTTVVHVL